MQMQADFLGTPVVRSNVTEATALGAAFLAGLTCGIWSSTDEFDAIYSVERVFEPSVDPERLGERKQKWSQALQRSQGWDTQ